ncbi:hypothetical protein [Agromyces sp. LHK192]|uniref:hypothetical protein n=1 Tax=Agromyces sp. LHK192 TaxID=2498704 RepID=UPI000FD7C793|nr:hypothetical protein [Agromyces sp. LHK192]
MRFVFAIAAFVAAAVLIGLGIAQRTVFLEPGSVSLQVQVDAADADYVVIEPDALAAYPGKQSVTIAGEGSTYFAYGRSSDVLAWLGDDEYVAVGYDAESGELTDRLMVDGEPVDAEPDAPSTTAPATDAPATDAPATTAPATPDATAPADTEGEADAVAVSPSGSDLWLEEQAEESGRLARTVDLPDGISMLVASGSEDPVPDRIAIAWPLDNSTPWVGPLLTLGSLLFVVGVILLISGIVGHKRSRGPRRNLPKGGRGRLPSAPKPGRKQAQLSSGRRSSGTRRAMIAGFAMLPALALTACSPDYWPSFDEAAAPETTAPATVTPTPAPGADGEEPEAGEEVEPAVTVPQMERIMARISDSAGAADAALDATAAAERFTGPALQAREANYRIRAALPDRPALAPIPASPLEITLPQQSRGGVWPRTVLEVVQNGDDPSVAPSALVLVQESPRENYKIMYAMSLVPDADPPEVAPASIGAPIVTPDSKLLMLPPSQLATAYADVLINGDASQYAALFELEGDALYEQLGPTGQQAEAAKLPATAGITFANQPGASTPVSLATNDSGALVTVSIEQTEQVRPNDGGTIGFEPGPGAAMSGFTEKSAKGVQRTRGIQVLFYVPAVGSEDPIRVLGWSESLIGASEIP